MPENPGATIAEHFSSLEDPRMDRTKLHPLKKVMVALRFVSAGRRHILITWHLCINRSPVQGNGNRSRDNLLLFRFKRLYQIEAENN